MIDRAHRRVIFASSLGTVFEWYDFYLYGSLAAIISKKFFAGVNETTAFIFALLAFAAGFFVRPFGAIVFGRLGDLVGRKHTFLITIVIMGVSTALVGLLPATKRSASRRPSRSSSCACCRVWRSAVSTAALRPMSRSMRRRGKRGLYTSWIQTTATLGTVPVAAGDPRVPPAGSATQFENWGWRMPFLLSIMLLAVSVYIRLQLQRVAGIPGDEGGGQALDARR